MRWQTETQIPEFPFRINHGSSLLLLGSCFAENMGLRLQNAKFTVLQNPTGIVYNPHSLLQTVELLCGKKSFTKSDLHFANNLHFSYQHHSRFSATSAEVALKNMNTAMDEARKNLPKTDVVFITLGTAFYWWLKSENCVVNNCHKQPATLFEQKFARVAEVKTVLQNAVDLLKTANPEVQIVFTISPIRHLKHGSAGNQLSKSTLLVAAQELAASAENVHYFPSYELLLDDLRDYRFYEEDLIHPNKQAVDYIWEKFAGAFFTPKTVALNAQISGIQNMLNHRVFVANTASAKSFLATLQKAISACEISFETELEDWKKANGF